MTDRCETCWSDAGLLVPVLGGSQESRYAELVQANHSEDTP